MYFPYFYFGAGDVPTQHVFVEWCFEFEREEFPSGVLKVRVIGFESFLALKLFSFLLPLD